MTLLIARQLAGASCSYSTIVSRPLPTTHRYQRIQPALQHSRRYSSRVSCNSTEDDQLDTSAPADQLSQGSWAYPVITALAAAGVADTAYLTFVKLFHAPLVCPTSGCESVLTSEYSELFGIPLALIGVLAYAAVGGLAFACGKELSSSATTPERREILGISLMGGVSILASCSAVLVYLLQTKFVGSPCAWCYLSAGISFSMLATAVAAMDRRQLQEAAGPGLGVMATTVLLLFFGLGGMGSVTAQSEDFQLPYSPPTVTSPSSDRSVKLAKQLKNSGAKMYGAFWCSHCFDQKQTFGAQAMKDFPYVECYPNGWQRGEKVAEACDVAGIRAFPTWIINGKTIEGELDFDALDKELSQAAVQAPAVSS